MNKPYHIVVWDTLNEVFGKEWKWYFPEPYERVDDVSTYDYVCFKATLEISETFFSFSIRAFWESGKIELDYYTSNPNSEDFCFEFNGKSSSFQVFTFDNLETFKQFLEYNKRRFFNE